jgi:hypothetical protein
MIRQAARGGLTRTASVLWLLAVLLLPGAAGAQGAATLADLAPMLSLDAARLDDAPAFDSGASPQPERVEERGLSAADVISPITVTSSVTWQPTYERRADGSITSPS